MQCQHARCPQHHFRGFELRADQGHARQGALGQKMPLRIHHHPGAVQIQACFGQHSLLHLDTGARFHGVDKQPRNGSRHIEFGF